jgi:hypothetical protein
VNDPTKRTWTQWLADNLTAFVMTSAYYLGRAGEWAWTEGKPYAVAGLKWAWERVQAGWAWVWAWLHRTTAAPAGALTFADFAAKVAAMRKATATLGGNAIELNIGTADSLAAQLTEGMDLVTLKTRLAQLLVLLELIGLDSNYDAFASLPNATATFAEMRGWTQAQLSLTPSGGLATEMAALALTVGALKHGVTAAALVAAVTQTDRTATVAGIDLGEAVTELFK